jgi:preprotein translocase subunit YajC
MRGPLNTMIASLPLVLAQTSPLDPRGLLVPFAVMLGIMYLLVIRPQQKQAKDTQTMLAALKKGDDVVTSGGLLGRVVAVDEKVVTLDVGQGTKVRVLKQSIQSKVTVEPKAEGGKDKAEAKGDGGEAKKEEK